MASRRLAAILFTDIKGFSSRMGRDEEGTFALLQVHNRILDEVISAHGGRVVKTIGDAYMAEFSSSVVAVACALDIQRALARHNMARPGDDIRVRIGVHAGDVLVDGDDLFGEAVNVAARLEPQAPPGAVCVSPEVLEQVKGKVRARVEPLGRRALKNMGDRELHALHPADAVLRVRSGVVPSRRPRRVVAVTGLLAVVAVVLAVVWWPRPPAPGGTLRIGYNGALDDAPEVMSGFSRMIEDTVEDRLQVVQADGTAVDGAVVAELVGLTGARLTLAPGLSIAPHPCVPEGRPATLDDLAWSLDQGPHHGLGIESRRLDGDGLLISWNPPNVYGREFLASIRFRGRPPPGCPDDARALSTGPYYVDGQTPGGAVTLRAHPRRRTPGESGLTEIVWSPVSTSAAGQAALRRGEIDLYFPSYEDVIAETVLLDGRRVLQQPVAGVQVGRLARLPSMSSSMRLFVTMREGSPLSDLRLRQAIAIGVDRDALGDEPSFGAPLGRLLAPSMLGYSASGMQFRLDPERARALVSESVGAEAKVEVSLGFASGAEGAAARIAEQLAQVGFQVRPVALTNLQMGTQLHDPTVDVVLSGSGQPVSGADPVFLLGAGEMVDPLLGSQGTKALRERIVGEPDRVARDRLYAELERVLLETGVIIPLAVRDVADGAGGSTVYYGPRLAGVFDETGEWPYPQDWSQVGLD